MRSLDSGKTARRRIWALILLLVIYVSLHSGLMVAQDSTPKSPGGATKTQKVPPKTPPKSAGKDAQKTGGPGQGEKAPQSPAPNQSPDSKAQDAQGAKDQTAATSAKPTVPDPQAVEVFWHVFRLISGLLMVMFVTVGISLIAGKWSLGEALSEESSVQPVANQVKMVASTSRFIALFGLLGILTTVLGIGYAIIWNLLLYQKPPEGLSQVRSFLLGAACLFAPYLANQLRAAFESSPDKSGANGGANANGANANPAAPNPVAPNPAAPNPAVPNPAAPNPAVPNPAAPNPAVPNPAVPNPAAPNPAVPNPAVPNPAVPNPAVPNPAVPNPNP
jgi:hypothetical protein